LARIVQYLVDRDLRLEVVEKVGTVQRADVEVLGAKLVLGQQGTEHEHGVVAAREGLGVVDLWQPPAARLSNARLGGLHSRAGGCDGLIFADSEAHCFAQRERVLRP
jgi:hypothetical protein